MNAGTRNALPAFERTKPIEVRLACHRVPAASARGRVSRAAAEDALETCDERRIAQQSGGAFRGTQRIESALVMRTGQAGEVRDTAENWTYVPKPVIPASGIPRQFGNFTSRNSNQADRVRSLVINSKRYNDAEFNEATG
ncbi:MAG TPA: hypothetical protein VKR31_08245 [Rhizomicrobium sp.]|nr:hypothetical protein [Rhizomicrobium sp.]